MRSLLKVSDLTKEEILQIFEIADHLEEYKDTKKGKRYVTFFPDTSVRTLTTFEPLQGACTCESLSTVS